MNQIFRKSSLLYQQIWEIVLHFLQWFFEKKRYVIVFTKKKILVFWNIKKTVLKVLRKWGWLSSSPRQTKHMIMYNAYLYTSGMVRLRPVEEHVSGRWSWWMFYCGAASTGWPRRQRWRREITWRQHGCTCACLKKYIKKHVTHLKHTFFYFLT